MLGIACREVFVQSICASRRIYMHAEKSPSSIYVAEEAAGCFAFTNFGIALRE